VGRAIKGTYRVVRRQSYHPTFARKLRVSILEKMP
jgi:hypothetical protein